MRRNLILVATALMAAVVLATSCGGSASPAGISGMYVYRDAPAGQAPAYDFRSNGTVVITIPADVNWKNDPQPEERKLTWFYETSIRGDVDVAEVWEEEKGIASGAPDIYFTIYEDGLVDSQGRVLTREGPAIEEAPPSSDPTTPPTPSSTP